MGLISCGPEGPRPPARRQTCRAESRCAASSSGRTSAPASSRSRRNRTAPSPAASGGKGSAATRSASSAGVATSGPHRRSPPGSSSEAKASERFASMTARRGLSPAAGCSEIPRASASRDETPASGLPVPWASARAVAIPTRSPVNDPGPIPTAIRSTRSHPPASATACSTSPSSSVAWRAREPAGGDSSRSATDSVPRVTATATSAVAVSKPTTIECRVVGLMPRTIVAALAALSLAVAGAAWSGCGGDDEDAANEQVDEIQEQVDEATEDVEGEAQEGVDKAQEKIDKAQEQYSP